MKFVLFFKIIKYRFPPLDQPKKQVVTWCLTQGYVKRQFCLFNIQFVYKKMVLMLYSPQRMM